MMIDCEKFLLGVYGGVAHTGQLASGSLWATGDFLHQSCQHALGGYIPDTSKHMQHDQANELFTVGRVPGVPVMTVIIKHFAFFLS